MINLDDWLNSFVKVLRRNFGGRIWFIGVQGSYARGEAADTSDLDVVVILDEFTISDAKKYSAVLDELPHRNLICGFISGRSEILNWDAAELFQFYYDTTPVFGSLEILQPRLDVDRAIKTGACTIYHGCVHNLIHEKSADILKSLYKTGAFVVQAIHFRKTGEYVHAHKNLTELADSAEKKILQNFFALKNGGVVDFDKLSEEIFLWSKNLITA